MSRISVSARQAALRGSLRDYRAPEGPDLLRRVAAFHGWQSLQREHDLWPHDHTAGPLDFAGRDDLGLSAHPAVKAAATEAIAAHGTLPADPLPLETALSDFLGARQIVLYPSGWAAGYGAVQGLVRANDHVVMDIHAPSGLRQGACSVTQHIHYHAHLDIEALAARLERIRAHDGDNAILVATSSLFPASAGSPDLAAMRALCHDYGATLLVDCAHDLGGLGDDGLGRPDMLATADILVGDCANAFAATAGFIAVRHRATAEYLRYYSATHAANALAPAETAAILAALAIVRSPEGATLRRKLMDNILYLRAAVTRAGLEVLGDPAPIVPVHIGIEAIGRLARRHLAAHGGVASLLEHPAVPRGGARFRFHLTAAHNRADIEAVVRLLAGAMRHADREYRRGHEDAPAFMARSDAA